MLARVSIRQAPETVWFSSPADVTARLGGTGYLADDATATSPYLAGALEKPLLVRLQCYEGLDESDLDRAIRELRLTGRRP
jgi:hypothetical protein